jgi:hypothetical protein
MVVDTVASLAERGGDKPPRLEKRMRIGYFVAYPKSARYPSLLSEEHRRLAHLMRIFGALDGKPDLREWNAFPGLVDALCDNTTPFGEMCTYETEYFGLSWKKSNSNNDHYGEAHITFKNAVLVDRVNEILRKHVPDELAPGGEK